MNHWYKGTNPLPIIHGTKPCPNQSEEALAVD